MGDLKEVFRSLQELFPEVDHRILKAIAIEHRKDVDSAVVTVLDEVMPFMTGSAGVDGSVGNLSSMDGSVGNLFGNHSTHEVGSSSSVWRDICINEIDASVYSVQYTSYGDVKTGKQENINNTYVGRLASIEGVNEQLNLHSYPIPNGGQHDLLPNLDVLSSNTDPEKTLANTDNEVGYSGLFSECFSQPPTGEDGGNIIAPQPCDQDPNGMIPVGDYFPQNSSMEFFSGYEDYNFDDGLLPIGSNDQISFRILGTEKDPFAPVLDVPGRDKEESSTETSGFIESSNNVADMLPDLNLNHFTSTASTHSNHSVSIESLEDSVADARSNKLMLSDSDSSVAFSDVEASPYSGGGAFDQPAFAGLGTAFLDTSVAPTGCSSPPVLETKWQHGRIQYPFPFDSYKACTGYGFTEEWLRRHSGVLLRGSRIQPQLQLVHEWHPRLGVRGVFDLHGWQPADASDEQGWEFLDHLTNCGSLQVLALDDNKLGGQLPGSIAQLLREIQALDIGKTRISGSIPPAIGDLIGLTTLGLESNLLNGTIPAGIGDMKNLTKLALQGNRLTRPIPSSISDLTQLLELDLSSNALSGFIPDTLANLTSPSSPTLLS
ncbi:hypothetical protein ZEAMMB73_Zm00001d010292 [Zea mays]|uniref:Uncharacterized protein n=1 Tax=Zea mays TaxID=4577 RepID=A0A1D6FQ88_MAIZE|nr:hypothetical protein ZEAMMB73_Zm00001d010292 [Zea mays]